MDLADRSMHVNLNAYLGRFIATFFNCSMLNLMSESKWAEVVPSEYTTYRLL